MGIITLSLLFAALAPKEMYIEREITIDKPVQKVFDYIKFVKNHETFSPWVMMELDMKKDYRGTDGQVGFVFAWDSSKRKNVGTGEQEIKKIVEGSSIAHEFRFIKPMQSIANAEFITEPLTGDRTKVQWGFHSKMKYPTNIMRPMVKNMLGKNLETGLLNLKSILEK